MLLSPQPPERLDDMHELCSVDGNTPVVEAHRLIDEAIERHQASPSIQMALKSQRNSFAPISCLPAEILCEIFSIIKSIEPHGVSHARGKPSLQWFKVTWVSRHWRNVGIGSPSLWTDPPLTHLSCVEQMLIRSKNSGLVLDAHPAYNARSFRDGVKVDLASEDSSFPGLKLALEQSQRLKHLSLCIDVEQWQEIQTAFRKVAPQLEDLRLMCWNHSLASGRDPKPKVFGSEEVLSNTPKLRRLHLVRFELNWNTHSHLLRALTHLELDLFSLNSQMTWKRLSDVLKQMPDLQVLHLNDSLPTGPGVPVSWTSTYLASLQKLSIRCSTTQAEILFSCIAFPPTTMVKIECPVPSRTNSDVVSLLMQIGKLYSNKLDTYFQSLVLLEINPSDKPYGLGFRLFLDALDNKEMLDHDSISASLECMFTWGPSYQAFEIFTKTINDIFSHGIPLQDISRVYLTETLSALRPDTLANTIGKLSQMHSVMTSECTGRLLVDAMELDTHDQDTSSVVPFKSPYFQNLSAICFHATRIRAQYKRRIREDDPDYLPVERLNNCLIQRSKSGMGLSKLTFRRCRRMLKGDVVLLGKTVDDVDWDGIRLN